MPPDWTLQLLLILVSPAVGSFLGVLVERLPRGQSVLTRSRCADCGAGLAVRDMVPILSALILRGRCRRCNAAFPEHLLRLEIAAFGAGVLAALTATGTLQMVALAGVLWCLIALFYCDLLFFRLPDPLTGALFISAMALTLADPARQWLEALMGAALGSSAFLAIRIGYRALRGREGLGLGDVKLMAGIGAALGGALVPVVTLMAALLGLLVVGLTALRQRKLPGGTDRLPLGTFLCAATALMLLAGRLGFTLPGRY